MKELGFRNCLMSSLLAYPLGTIQTERLDLVRYHLSELSCFYLLLNFCKLWIRPERGGR